MATMSFEFEGIRYTSSNIEGGRVMWQIEGSPVAVLMVAPRQSWSDEVQAIYSYRVVANLSLICPVCGASAKGVQIGSDPAHGTLAHEGDCMVGNDELLAELFTA